MARDRRTLPLQLRAEVVQLIEQDGLKAGAQLPTEAELAARFGVARTTVREALKLLEQGGVIDVRHGLGRFVSALPELKRSITRLESVTEMMQSLGHTVTNRVIDVRERGASNSEAAALGVAVNSPVINLERIRSQGDDVLIFSVDVLPRHLIDGQIDQIAWSESLLDLLEARGHRVSSAAAEIRAVSLPRRIASFVGEASRGPWLLMVHVNVSETGQPLIYSHDYYRGGKFTFNVLRRRTE
ncbi:MAG: GntR family transcriptional regulator [Chloroflexi bacterium]|nr:GntR family transcriptional regulator [Chloroflexota bacterium]